MIQIIKLNSQNHQAIIIELKGELDTEGVKEIEPTLLQFCEGQEKYLILDCTNLRYINSLGLGLMVKAFKKASENQRNLILAGLQEPIWRLFEIVRFHRIFSIYENVGQALNFIDAND